MSFSFSAPQPAANSHFGQTPAFGTQQPFGGTTAAPNSLPQFGSSFGAPTATTGLSFGNVAATTPSLFGQAQTGGFATTSASSFGSPGLFGATSSAPSTGLTFGATSAAPAFGGGLSFGGTPTSAPAFAAPPTAAPTQPPTFGLGATFGTPASTQSTTLAFGTSTAAQSTALRFGTPSSTGLTFGTTQTAPSTGISFGATPTTGLSFGTPATTSSFGAPATSGISFGTPATTGLSFGAAAPFTLAATTAQTTGLGGTTSTPNPSIGTPFNLGGTPATTSISLPTPATTGLNFMTSAPTSLTFSAASSIPSSGLSFATPTTASSLGFGAKTTGGLTFGTPSLTTSGTSTGLSFATTSAATNTGLFGGLGLTTTSSTATPSVGLGGIPAGKASTPATSQFGLGGISTAPKQTAPSSTAPQSEIPPKDQQLPNELLQTVESFKAFLKEQKANSSEIARFSMKELKNVETNIVSINNTINELENELQRNKCGAEKLKLDTAQALQYAEMAQRTFEMPAGMQYDNTVPINFFMQLLQNFERDLQQLRFHLETVNKQVKNNNSRTELTPEDLTLGLRRLHQTFVTLAGRLQTVHNQVEIQKEHYIALRKELLDDSSNVFESQNKELEALEYALKSIANENKLPEVAAGPSPFNSLGTGQAQLLAQNPPPAYPGTTLGQPTSGTQSTPGPNITSLFGTSFGNTLPLFNNSSTSNSFQLQKPPTGSKRGKT